MAVNFDDPDDAYQALHWGEEPEEEWDIDDPRFAGEELILLGSLSELTYTTTKGGTPLTDYVHEFGEDPPLLVIDSRGRLQIIGGGYRITEHGIED